jgi:DNA (cytosine-5)-methyltransferase 1
LYELALFAGCGGGLLATRELGWQCVGALEYDPWRAERLAQRRDEGHLGPWFPVWNLDVREFAGPVLNGYRRLARRADLVISGGFPCQDLSAAGKQAGLDGERSGLYAEMLRVIGEVGPRYVLMENVAAITSRPEWAGRVAGELAELGYDCRWGVVSAADAGAPHLRKRWFC